MAAPTKDDFERCNELNQWYKNHSGECPRRKSDDNTEASLARWLDKARSRRARAHDNTPSGRKLTASGTAHLNNIMATQRPKSKTQRPKPSTSKRWRQKSTKHEIERCKQLRHWYINHSGKRPLQSSDDKTEASLALWLNRSLIRRTRAVNNRPCLRQLTTKETARLNSINFIARDLNPVPEDTGSTALPDDFERCNELRRWCLSHSGERPHRKSDDKKQTSLARWLERARVRRARSVSKWPSDRQLTAKGTAQLNSILASASKSRTTATDLNADPEGTQQSGP